MKYRKKPIIVEAEPVKELLVNASHNWYALPRWVRENYEKGNIVFLKDSISIMTLEGRMKADYYDYLIQGVKGEIYPCKPDVFESTYDPVEEV